MFIVENLEKNMFIVENLENSNEKQIKKTIFWYIYYL